MIATGIWVIPLILLAGMLVLGELGRSLARRRNAKGAPATAFLALEGAVFGLMGLLIAFTFSAAASRFEQRRQVLVEEANAIGTAWLRLSILPEHGQEEMRKPFREYIDNRLAFYKALPDAKKALGYLRQGEAIQDKLWAHAVEATRDAPSPAVASLVLPPLNAMIDITTTGTMLAKTHLPVLIRTLLAALMLMCALLSGFESAANPNRSWVHTLIFALMLSLTLYVIFDLDYPRMGLIRVDDFDDALLELQSKIAGGQ